VYNQCRICGTGFEAKTARRMLCDKCQKNSSKEQARMNKAVYLSKLHSGEFMKREPQELVCKLCNKEYITYNNSDFCSEVCQIQNFIDTARCRICGVLLISVGIELTRGGACCSDECREIRRWNRAKKKGTIRTCTICSKEFINPGFSTMLCGVEGHITVAKNAERLAIKSKNLGKMK